MTSVIVREYQPDDWHQSCRVHDMARPIELEGSCDPAAFVPLATEEEDIEDFHRSKKFVACVDEEIVGFVGVDHDEVTWLYVDPAVFGQGIGRLLLRKGLEVIDGETRTFVLDGNNKARRLYESEGFSVVREFDSENNGFPCSVLELVRGS